MDPKEKLYYLIEEFSHNNYRIEAFCDQFTAIYNLELDYDKLTSIEQIQFRHLNQFTSRFSPFKSDLEQYDCYYDEFKIREEVRKVRNSLNI